MKRAFWFMALGLATIATTGCNRGWPRLFCLPSSRFEVIEQCEPCTSYYGGEVTGGEWSSGGTVVEVLPGPASS